LALSSTLYRFQVELADIDRGIYESLDLRVAQHPSESEERMVVRVLARALAHEEGLEFGRGLSNVEDPALVKKSMTSEVEIWIDVGIPGADRLHRASKRADRVLVFTHKLKVALRKEWSSRSIHGADRIEVYQLDPGMISSLTEQLARSVTWYLTVQDGNLSVAEGERSVEGPVRKQSLADFLARVD
jgi:uncharacterized protein YaeQ